jgi:hypothetical protein
MISIILIKLLCQFEFRQTYTVTDREGSVQNNIDNLEYK